MYTTSETKMCESTGLHQSQCVGESSYPGDDVAQWAAQWAAANGGLADPALTETRVSRGRDTVVTWAVEAPRRLLTCDLGLYAADAVVAGKASGRYRLGTAGGRRRLARDTHAMQAAHAERLPAWRSAARQALRIACGIDVWSNLHGWYCGIRTGDPMDIGKPVSPQAHCIARLIAEVAARAESNPEPGQGHAEPWSRRVDRHATRMFGCSLAA